MFNRKRIAIVLSAGIFTFTGIGAGVAAATASPATANANYCVTFGHGATAAGNTVEYNWDHSKCPVNAYPHEITGTTDDDSNLPYLPQDGFAFFAGSLSNTAFPPTVFTIVDDTNAPGTVVTYHCHFTAPVANPAPATDFTPGISCTK